jgi:hypothetical protein
LGIPLFERKIEKIEDRFVCKIESLLVEPFIDLFTTDQLRDKGCFQQAIPMANPMRFMNE